MKAFGQRAVLVLAWAAIAAGLGACKRDEVRAYGIPKAATPRPPQKVQSPSQEMNSGAIRQGMVPAANASVVGERVMSFALPAGWEKDASASSVVAAAYTGTSDAGSVRITATSLFSDGGGLLANINRWRGQLQLDPVESLDKQTTREVVPGVKAVDLTDASGSQRMIVAVVDEPGGNRTWYFKLTGSVGGVEVQREAFDRFVKHAVQGAP